MGREHVLIPSPLIPIISLAVGDDTGWAEKSPHENERGPFHEKESKALGVDILQSYPQRHVALFTGSSILPTTVFSLTFYNPAGALKYAPKQQYLANIKGLGRASLKLTEDLGEQCYR